MLVEIFAQKNRIGVLPGLDLNRDGEPPIVHHKSQSLWNAAKMFASSSNPKEWDVQIRGIRIFDLEEGTKTTHCSLDVHFVPAASRPQMESDPGLMKKMTPRDLALPPRRKEKGVFP